MLFTNVFFIIMFIVSYFNIAECQTYKKIQNEDKRSADYVLDASIGPYINDVSLSEDWYRNFGLNGDAMPTFAPGELHCGTLHPIWLNGILKNIYLFKYINFRRQFTKNSK